MTGPDQRPNNPPDANFGYTPIFVISRDKPMSNEFWDQVSSKSFVGEKGRQLFVGMKANIETLAGMPAILGITVREGLSGMMIITPIVDPSSREVVDLDGLEAFASSVGKDSGMGVGITIAERELWKNETRMKKDSYLEEYSFKFD